MTLKSIEKLRGYANERWWEPWVDARKPFHEMLDAVEAEVAERYIELPCDADGVPIHVGDTVEYPNGSRDVVRFITVNDNEPTFNEMGWIGGKCRHVKPRTLEDVLEALSWESEDLEYDGDRPALIAKYAAEIRDLLGVKQ